ncbi:hypothetical protein [Eubacterium oxidoreducens]|uniref:Subtilase family protein n=1 Tax=Eubacterium oxidoreducens TaxID=1732 RepID=A0A1G6B1L5_EUBOX|nr:hypothetical protein [Eubacterium oxidoreducens]SDB14538.1 hypothetical protein SAMN02910417_01055 [Eubacterium oxidoreducens]
MKRFISFISGLAITVTTVATPLMASANVTEFDRASEFLAKVEANDNVVLVSSDADTSDYDTVYKYRGVSAIVAEDKDEAKDIQKEVSGETNYSSKIEDCDIETVAKTQVETDKADEDEVIALIDTAVDTEYVQNIVNDSMAGDGDTSSHGTIMASILNEYSDASILPLGVYSDNGTATVLETYVAIELAIQQKNVTVINLSVANTGKSKLLQEAIQDANDKGIAVICAVGNDSADSKDYIPANIDGAIGVGAVEGGSLADYSNYGDYVDFVSDGEYSYDGTIVSGTSISSAYVSALYSTLDGDLEERLDGLSKVATKTSDGYDFVMPTKVKETEEDASNDEVETIKEDASDDSTEDTSEETSEDLSTQYESVLQEKSTSSDDGNQTLKTTVDSSINRYPVLATKDIKIVYSNPTSSGVYRTATVSINTSDYDKGATATIAWLFNQLGAGKITDKHYVKANEVDINLTSLTVNVNAGFTQKAVEKGDFKWRDESECGAFSGTFSNKYGCSATINLNGNKIVVGAGLSDAVVINVDNGSTTTVTSTNSSGYTSTQGAYGENGSSVNRSQVAFSVKGGGSLYFKNVEILNFNNTASKDSDTNTSVAYADNYSTLSFNGCNIHGNKSYKGLTISVSTESGDKGHCEFEMNKTSSSITNGGRATSFYDNYGGISTRLATITLNEASLSNNRSCTYVNSGNTQDTANAVFRIKGGSTATLSGVEIKNNTTYATGTIVVTNSTVTQNGNVSIHDNSVKAQSDESCGSAGGLYLNGNSWYIDGHTLNVYNNTAQQNGGGIVIGSGTLYASGTLNVHDNTASSSSGGIRVTGGTLDASGTVKVYKNKATNGGGGIHVYGGTVTSSGTVEVYKNTTSSSASGVLVNGGGKFNVNGGTMTVYENSGGSSSVKIGASSTFTNTGTLTIRTDKTSSGLVALLYDIGTFTNDGTLSLYESPTYGLRVGDSSDSGVFKSTTNLSVGVSKANTSGGIYVTNASSTVSISGEPVLYGNTGNALTVNNGKVTVTGAMFANSSKMLYVTSNSSKTVTLTSCKMSGDSSSSTSNYVYDGGEGTVNLTKCFIGCTSESSVNTNGQIAIVKNGSGKMFLNENLIASSAKGNGAVLDVESGSVYSGFSNTSFTTSSGNTYASQNTSATSVVKVANNGTLYDYNSQIVGKGTYGVYSTGQTALNYTEIDGTITYTSTGAETGKNGEDVTGFETGVYEPSASGEDIDITKTNREKQYVDLENITIKGTSNKSVVAETECFSSEYKDGVGGSENSLVMGGTLSLEDAVQLGAYARVSVSSKITSDEIELVVATGSDSQEDGRILTDIVSSENINGDGKLKIANQARVKANSANSKSLSVYSSKKTTSYQTHEDEENAIITFVYAGTTAKSESATTDNIGIGEYVKKEPDKSNNMNGLYYLYRGDVLTTTSYAQSTFLSKQVDVNVDTFVNTLESSVPTRFEYTGYNTNVSNYKITYASSDDWFENWDNSKDVCTIQTWWCEGLGVKTPSSVSLIDDGNGDVKDVATFKKWVINHDGTYTTDTSKIDEDDTLYAIFDTTYEVAYHYSNLTKEKTKTKTSTYDLVDYEKAENAMDISTQTYSDSITDTTYDSFSEINEIIAKENADATDEELLSVNYYASSNGSDEKVIMETDEDGNIVGVGQFMGWSTIDDAKVAIDDESITRENIFGDDSSYTTGVLSTDSRTLSASQKSSVKKLFNNVDYTALPCTKVIYLFTAKDKMPYSVLKAQNYLTNN